MDEHPKTGGILQSSRSGPLQGGGWLKGEIPVYSHTVPGLQEAAALRFEEGLNLLASPNVDTNPGEQQWTDVALDGLSNKLG